jgi:hypothetical protein
MQRLEVDRDFDYLCQFLPEGWEVQAKRLGALRRCRRIPDARILLRILLIHLAEGCSLRETAVRSKHGNLAQISDVTVMNRLRMSGEWFRWINQQMIQNWIKHTPAEVWGSQQRIRVVDGSQVKEPGPTGTTWVLHYAIDLPSLACGQVILMPQKKGGETFRRFKVRPGDVMMGDRAYGSAPGISHVLNHGGNVLVRFAWSNLKLWETPEKEFDLFSHLDSLHGTRLGDWPVLFQGANGFIPGRVCAVKKSRQAAERAVEKARKTARRHGVKIKQETLDAARYVFVFTTLPKKQLSTSQVLEMYRGRWQVELVFKRMKSILGLGHLRKIDETAAESWLQGKLLVALLIEALLRRGESFFPWGYPIYPANPE